MATAKATNLPTVDEIRVRRRRMVFLPGQVEMQDLMRRAGEPIVFTSVDPRPFFVEGDVVDVGPGPHRFSEPCL